MASEEVFTIDADNFPNSGTPAKIDPSRLDEAIRADGGVPGTFDGIIIEPTEGRCRAVFSATIDAGERAALVAVLAAHDGLPASPLRLDNYRATNGTDHRQVNYKTGLTCRLFKTLAEVFRGEVRRIEYFSDEAKTNLILFVDVVYTRDASGLATERTTTRTWKRQDNTDHPQKKTTKKKYDNFHAAKEGNRRRGNVIGQLKIDVLSMIIATTAADPANPTQAEVDAANVTGIGYLSKYQTQLGLYVETGDLTFKVSPASPNITDDAESFLDSNVTAYGWTGPTIRDEILGALQEINA